mmetsp:Transcript_16680/g.34867  ORF Transcript_16680/g.34867 Transcript_16680/m.34867 type:complete len:282 (-) Transcript_16680:9-854(-)
MRLQDLDTLLLSVHRRHGQRGLSLGIRLGHIGTNLEQILQKFLAPVACSIVQSAIARTVHGVGIGSAVQQELHDGYSVGANGISQRSDALMVLGVQRFLFCQEVLHGLHVSILGRLVQSQCSLIDLLQDRLQLRRKTAHLLADLQHEVFILVVLHGGFHAVLLDVFEDARQLRIFLQGLDAICDRRIATGQLGVVVLCNGLSLEPASHGFRILGKVLKGSGRLWVAFHVFLHVFPGALVDVGQPRNLHGGAIIDLQSLSGRFHRHLLRCGSAKLDCLGQKS